MTNYRRSKVEKKLGLDTEKERKKREKAIAKETQRREFSEKEMSRIKESSYYKLLFKGAFALDIADAVFGLFDIIGGDIPTLIIGCMYVHFCLTRVRSVKLALVVAFVQLFDFLIGAIPTIGSFVDIFLCSNIFCRDLISGYIEGENKKRNLVNILFYAPVAVIIFLIWYIFFN